MAIKDRANRGRSGKKGWRNPQPVPAKRLTRDLRSSRIVPDETNSGFDGAAVRAQAALIGDTRLQRTQRHTLAVQMGQLAGNRYLTTAIAQARKVLDASFRRPVVVAPPGAAKNGSAPRQNVISRFGYGEHRTVGDVASGGKMVVLFPGSRTVPRYRISYGDMVALAGDYFASLQDMKDLARSPSGQREIEYARYKGGVASKPAGVTEQEQRNVTERYYRLNQTNFSHFSQTTTANSNLSKYIEGHAQAVEKAFLSRQGGGKYLQEALLIESFYDHFLTDAFTGGHMLAPRQPAEEHWGKMYPLFMENFFDHVAEHMANHIHSSSVLAWIFKTIPGLKSQVMSSVKEQAPPGADYSLGGLISVAIHDWNNKHGLEVVSAAGPRGRKVRGGHKWTAYGETTPLGDVRAQMQREMVLAAVRAGLRDLKAARRCRTLGQLKRRVGPPYKLERYVPKVDPASTKNVDIKWKFGSVDDLAKAPEIMAALKDLIGPSGTIGSMLDSAADALGTGPHGDLVQPAFKSWISRLRTSTGLVVREIANYVPGGTRHHATTDVLSRDYIERIKKMKGKNLAMLTTEQMVGLINKLLKGATGDADERAILDILRAANRRGNISQVVNRIGFQRLEGDIHGDEWDDCLKILKEKYFRGMPLTNKIAFIKYLFSEYSTGETGEEVCITILNSCSSTEFLGIVRSIGKGRLDKYLDGAEQDRFDELLRLHGYRP